MFFDILVKKSKKRFGESKVITYLCRNKKHMGVYIYTYKKKFDKNATLNGEKVVVGKATFLCKSDFGGRYTPSENREMTRTLNLEKDLQPDYITFDGENVYKNNKRGLWHDGSGFYCGIHHEDDFVGVLKKVGRKFVVEEYFIKK